MERLNRLNRWQLSSALLGIGLGTGVAVWAIVWVAWTIRPILAAACALIAVGWTTYGLRRHRDLDRRRSEEWLGS